MILATLDYLNFWNRNSAFLYRIKNPENVFTYKKNLYILFSEKKEAIPLSFKRTDIKVFFLKTFSGFLIRFPCIILLQNAMHRARSKNPVLERARLKKDA
ncbi:hypothetical protein DMI71_05725 [Akkermansia muciniphila]|uniref:hypothetical protein n=1 Tax=Akkermansia muciniphila TaxID=239935 RepID=UPI00138E6895|nr:hypothetical protein [Akkermansia muciniphila]QHV53390.1 hypothetical protein DMI71_05725 [Akkermansia muciniphila]